MLPYIGGGHFPETILNILKKIALYKCISSQNDPVKYEHQVMIIRHFPESDSFCTWTLDKLVMTILKTIAFYNCISSINGGVFVIVLKQLPNSTS